MLKENEKLCIQCKEHQWIILEKLEEKLYFSDNPETRGFCPRCKSVPKKIKKIVSDSLNVKFQPL